MTVSYASIKNNMGMSAQVIACAYGDSPDEGYGRKTLYSVYPVDAIHRRLPHAVKAIWASVMNGSPLKPQGFARYKVLRADKETDFLVVKRTPLQQVRRYHIAVEPKPDTPCLVITSQLGASREEALARYLATHTIYPAIPEWGEVLLGEGTRHKIVHRLETFGLDWAYKIDLWGWDEVIDQSARGGLLAFPTSN
jgi:hypothetical protein